MPTPKTLAGYPEWFFTVADKSLQGNGESLQFESKGAAISIRRKWYAWRKILDAGGHPQAPELQGVIIRLFEKPDGWWLNFSTVGSLSPLSKERLGITDKLISHAGEDPENIYALRPRSHDDQALLKETAAEIDRGEEIIAKLFGFNKGAIREGSNDVERVPSQIEMPKSKDCEHEWSLGRCLKCGIPQ